MRIKFNLSRVIFLSIIFAFTACSKDEDNEVESLEQLSPPIELCCDYYSDNAVPVDNANPPIDYIVLLILPHT